MKATNKNVYWIVSELFYPDEVSTAQILTDIALKKVNEGAVKVICGPSGYEKAYSSQNKVLDSRIEICRVKLPHLNKNNIFQRILKMLLLTLKMAWIILVKVKRGDTLLLVTNPTFLIVPVSFIIKIKKFNLEILVHDVFPENLVPAGFIKNGTLKYRILCKVFNYSYSKANRLIVLGEDMRKLMIKKTYPRKINIDIIPNWADEGIMPVENFDASNYLSLDLENKIVIGFSGNLGRVQGILEFIELFKTVKNDDIVLVFIGDGALRLDIQNKIEKEKLSNIFYIGSKSRSEQNLFLNSFDIGLVTLKKGMKGLGVPSKSYNIMAAGKPIFYIGDKESEIDNYVNDYKCGWSFSWDNDQEIILFLSQLSINDSLKVKEFGENSRRTIELYYEKDKVLNLF